MRVANRPYTQRETRLLGEFLTQRFPNDRVISQVRLGSPMPAPRGVPQAGGMGRMLANYRRYADALVIRRADMILIEAKIIADPGIVSTLQLYGALLPSTAELKEFAHLPLRLMLVWAVNDPVLATIAKRHGIEVEIFTPAWVLSDLQTVYAKRLRGTTATYTPESVLASKV